MTNNNETLDERDIALVRATIDSVEISERLLNVQNACCHVIPLDMDVELQELKETLK